MRVVAGLGHRGEAGAVAGGEAHLAQAAAVGRGGQLHQSSAGDLGQTQPGGDVQQRPPRLVAQQPLAVDDHDLLAGRLQRLQEVLHRAGVRARRGGGAAEVAVVAGQRRVQRHQERLAGAGRVAQDRRRAGIERRRPRAGHDELHAMAADALAQAQVEDRRVVDRVAVQQQHGVGELEVRHRRLQVGVVERAQHVQRHLAAGPGAQVAGAEEVAQQPLEQERLFVGRLAAGQRGRARRPPS